MRPLSLIGLNVHMSHKIYGQASQDGPHNGRLHISYMCAGLIQSLLYMCVCACVRGRANTDLGSLESDMLVILKVLHKYYPEVVMKSPSIGRQGKALRRQQLKRVLQSQHQSCEMEAGAFTMTNGELGGVHEQYKDPVLRGSMPFFF